MTKRARDFALRLIVFCVFVLALLYGLALAHDQYRPLTFFVEQPACKDATQVYLLRSRIHLGRTHHASAVWVCGLGGR